MESKYNHLRAYFFIAIPVIILLCYFIYKYNFNSRASIILSNISKYSNKEIKDKLPNCYELEPEMQYKLCDYYISSSYMTPCIGNQHYDYLSSDVIIEIMQAGARYIQIPICEADISPQAIPVIATAKYGEKLITSLNTLDVQSTLNMIRANAFKINNKLINYPLIIHFILNTTNAYTLSNLASIIDLVFKDILVDTKKLIFQEKLCNLLGKIILFATPEYQGTTLEKYIVPTFDMLKDYHFSELTTKSVIDKNTYTNNLSSKQQTLELDKFNAKYSQNTEPIDKLANIILEKENLRNYNKLGMSIVKPQNPDDIISKNYNPIDAVYNGCQFITMNFQIDDEHLQAYLKIFKTNSFQLKPDRLSSATPTKPNIINQPLYNKEKTANILNNIYYKYNNLVIALETVALPDTYLTHNDENLKFELAKKKPSINQCFIIKKSSITTGNEDIPLFLEALNDTSTLITFENNDFKMKKKAKGKEKLYKQSFYFEKSRSSIDSSVCIRTIDSQPLYIGFEHKQVRAFPLTTQLEAQNNMSFILHIVPFKMEIRILTIYDGSIKSMSGNILGVLENNTTDGTAFIIEPMNRTTNFNYVKDQFYLKNPKTNMYIVYDSNTAFLYDKALTPNTNCIFSLSPANSFYNIINNLGQHLILYQNNLLKFSNEDTITTNENLFKINLQYII